MKLLVIFSEPYFLLTEEEGIDEKECIEQALNKFNKEHLSGEINMEAYLNARAIEIVEDGPKIFSVYAQNLLFHAIYGWKVQTYDGKNIKDCTPILKSIIDDLEKELKRRTAVLEKNKKLALYRKLKKELNIE